MSEVSIEYLQHLVTIPAAVNGVEAHFVLDSGIGLTLVRNELAEAAGAQGTDRSFTGFRTPFLRPSSVGSAETF